MTRVLRLAAVGALLSLAACDDDLVKSGGDGAPLPPAQGIQAFIQVDRADAAPGQQVRVWVEVQLAADMEERLASYTGRLHFDPETLEFQRNVEIDDGLRVINPNGAAAGEIRFAGAQAGGFDDLTVYEGVFTVKRVGYATSLTLLMEELSGAALTDLAPSLQVEQQVFLREAGS